MKPVHQNARKVNDYVRMLTKEIMDEVNVVISSSDTFRRLTKLMSDSDNPLRISQQLKLIHAEPSDDKLCGELAKFISSLDNTELRSVWQSEMNRCIKCQVPDDKVPWDVPYPDYKPSLFTAWPVLHVSADPTSAKPPWADEDFTLKLDSSSVKLF